MLGGLLKNCTLWEWVNKVDDSGKVKGAKSYRDFVKFKSRKQAHENISFYRGKSQENFFKETSVAIFAYGITR